MTGSASEGEHVQLQLGLYVLGALSPDEHLSVERHLLRCPECAAESDELSEVPAFLALLTHEEVEELARESATPRPDGAEASTVRGGVSGVTAGARPGSTPPSARRRRRPIGPRAATRPAGTPASPGRPDDVRAGSSRPAHRYRFVVAVIGVALVVGVGLGLWLRSTVPVGVTLAGSETNVVTGVTMSVTVVGHHERSHVDADVEGLRPGVAYELFAVDIHGQARVVARWLADDASYHFGGDLDARAEDLAFFTVTRADGAVVVTVRVPASGRTAPSTSRAG